MNEMTPQSMSMIAESLERIEERQRCMSTKVDRIDVALRGTIDTGQLGIIARQEIAENAIADLQARSAATRTDMRGVLTTGLGGALGGAIAWIAAQVFGGK